MDQFPISEKLQLEHLLLIDKGYHANFIPGYTYTFFLTKPVDKEFNNIGVVVQAHKRGYVVNPCQRYVEC